ncbi:ran-specific GTPase-activating protein 30 [Trichomonascus vanleenenianus]|uniref:Yrb30p n=1 Tax=Trichomonascus vanleenenianus TaxID=2268995 RepID=UPI003ECA2E05
MEDLLAKAGSQAVTFAIRSGISIASSYAIKTLGKFLDKLPEDEKKNNLAIIKSRLQTKITIITPAIDLIELISARGNTSLSSTLELTQELKADIDEFEKKIESINEEILLSGRRTVNDSNQAVVKQVEAYIGNLLFRIEEAIPLISLALTTSGANLSSNLPDSVSPGRLLQAANYLSKGDTEFENKSRKSNLQIGPTFILKLYSIFYGTARDSHTTAAGDITWKEEFAKCSVKLWRAPCENKFDRYNYELTIEEDLDDGRYHDKHETVSKRVVDVCSVTRLFFSASGRLLEIEDSQSPVLVLKLNTIFNSQKSRLRQPYDHAGAVVVDELGHIEWLALELYDDGDSQESPLSDDSESESDTESESESPSSLDRVQERLDALSLSEQVPSLSLLEYLVRLSALQTNDQMSIYEITDERISLYLRDENHHASAAAPSASNLGGASSPVSTPSSSVRRRRGRRESRRLVSTPATPPPKPAMDLGAPATGGGNSSGDNALPMTPWERDRLSKNPSLLKKVLDSSYADSPLKNKKK